MEARTGSITVAAVLGTGLATLGFALSGVSALGDDLHAAAPATRAPVLTPGEESREALPATELGRAVGVGSPDRSTAAERLSLQEACDRKRKSGGGHGPTRPAPAEAGAGTIAKEY